MFPLFELRFSPVPNTTDPHRRKLRPRRGMTLVELIVASSIMALIVGGMAALAMTVEAGGAQGRETSTTLQHAEIVLHRIEAAMLDAHATRQFPGFAVFPTTHGDFDFPDTVVVWRPTGTPANPDGVPRFDEIVVFTPAAEEPGRMLEITAKRYPIDTPPLSDQNTWRLAINAMRTADTVERNTLTNRMRVAEINTANGVKESRAAVRFTVAHSPTDAELNSYPSSNDWDELPWVQDQYSSDRGTRQSWCRFELQLTTDPFGNSNPDASLPFFGSAAIYYQVRP